jgi:polysaccharide pyruvyl transferase WcaK-like protein
VSESSGAGHKPVGIGLLGAALDTGNMGVSALAESAIKCILHRWPNAEITLLDSGYLPGERQLRVGSRNVTIKELPIRFCRNVFFENHFVVLCFYAVLFKVFRVEKFRRFCARRNASLNRMVQIDMVVDIAGGDSFSDIYGMRRFVLGFLRKWLVLLFNKDLVMLPQTYGPFKRPLARVMARYILKRAKLIYSRDRAGVEYVNSLLNNRGSGKVRFVPDVAFVLDARKPKHLDIEPSADVRARGSIVVGLNVSGLLFNGGYNRNNMFGLSCNYRELIITVIETLLQDKKVSVLLIPHVFPPAGAEVESDPDACLKIYEQLRQKHAGRMFLVKGEYDQGEIKYIIEMCDFFVGSRMHSCIAALSQCIPAVGIAYSEKFSGVFESIGLENCVADVRNCGERAVFEKVEFVFKQKDKIREYLKQTVPQVKERILEIFTT